MAANSSLINPGESENSGASNNAIEVIATKLQFTTNFSPTLQAGINLSLQTPAVNIPVVQALDQNGYRDLDYNSTTIVIVDNAGRTLNNFPGASSLTAGLLTFPNNFNITSSGSGTLSVTTSTNNSLGTALTTPTATSSSFSVQTGTASTITPGAAVAATISSLVNASTGDPVFNFNVNDDPGGTPANQNDGSPTLISQVIITQNISTNTISNWTQAIAGAILTDGTNSMPGVVNATNITFSGIPTGTLGNVADNTTKNYTLRIWLRTAMLGGLVIDGQSFGFELITANILTLRNPLVTGPEQGTVLVSGQTVNFAAANQVTVVASDLRYTAPATASLNADFPGGAGFISVKATDANGNLDVGFTGPSSALTFFGNAIGGTMSNAPSAGSQFINGVSRLFSEFQIYLWNKCAGCYP
ncbi:MAG: hypothetical protein WDN75_10675 [Bacteroidota bacterium]